MPRLRHRFLTVAAFTLGVAACAAACPVFAQETGSLPETVGSSQAVNPEGLARLENALRQSRAKQDGLIATQSAAQKELEDLSDRLVTLAMTMSEQEASLALADGRLKKLSAAVAKAQLALAARRDELSKLLAGLQRLEQDPPPALVVNPNDVLQALRGAMMFSAVVPSLRDKADQLKVELQSLDGLKAKLETERKGHADGLAALVQSQASVTDLIAQKQALAERANQNLVAERKNAEALAQQATTLRDLLARLEAARKKAAADAAHVAAEQEKQAAAAKAKAAAATVLPDFASLRGKLARPAVGETLKGFGAETGLGHGLPGIAVKTAAHAQVTSPIGGRIEFAGRFRSYGGLVIINAGQDYLVLLAGMERIFTSTGQSVKAGEPLGEMGLKSAEMTLSNDLTNPAFPVLYVEFRKNTAPIDPSPWWVANSREAKK